MSAFSRTRYRMIVLALASSVGIGGCASVPASVSTDVRAGRESSRELRVIHYQPSAETFPNPERGFYGNANSMWLGSAVNSITASELRQLRSRGITLVRVYYVIDEFIDSPLSADALRQLQTDLDVVRDAGMKVIVRFTYNFPLGGLVFDFAGVEDAGVERVLGHIEQIEPILLANSDVIAFLEAGFVGAWGEWHHSSSGLLAEDGSINEHSRSILDRLLSALPSSRSVALRYPFLKQQIFGDEPLTTGVAFTGAPEARVGAHNDCFLRDAVDSGTYSRPGQYLTPPEFVEAQKQYLRFDNRFVPQGGETCAQDQQAWRYTGCRSALTGLARMRWSTINIAYHPDVIRRWQREGCFNEIEGRLGYRLRLITATVPARPVTDGILRLSLTIMNDGWAAPYNPRLVEIVLRHVDTADVHRIRVDGDPRFWLPGDAHRVTISHVLPDDLPDGRYQLLLSLPDPEPRLYARPEYSIRLANTTVWEPATGFNDMKVHVELENDRNHDRATSAD